MCLNSATSEKRIEIIITQIALYLTVHQLDVNENLLRVLLFPDCVVLQKRSPFSSVVEVREGTACHHIQLSQSGDKHSK